MVAPAKVLDLQSGADAVVPMTLRVEFQPKRLHRANRHDPQDLQVAPPAGPRAVHKIDREEQLGDGEADESRPWGRHVPLV
eukprot:1351741-Prymnesium_polylepis.1